MRVKVYKTKTNLDRSFTITGAFYAICKKYIDLRPNPCKNPCFFLHYNAGKCTFKRVGINKFGRVGKTIASYLNLPNSSLYTSHCFRRTSATLTTDGGEDLSALKRNDGWARDYIDESMINKIQLSQKNLNCIENKTNEVNINIPTQNPLIWGEMLSSRNTT